MDNQERQVNLAVANEILRQIKAQDFWALGAWGYQKPLAIKENGCYGVNFKVNGTKTKRGSSITITLNAMDLYDVKLSRFYNGTLKVDGEVKDVYFDQLIEVIDSLVG
jgi:hypothetical protein